MHNSIIQAQSVVLKELQHLFIDLNYEKETNKTYGVYRSRSFNQKNKKYLQLDEIKEALRQVDKKNLKYIYIIGNNAIGHPDFNHIVRLCLNIASVTICSDGSSINDKKARFLKRVEDEGKNELIFKISINHYDEKTNDELTKRGNYRKAVHAICSLNKYGFNPILEIAAQIEQFDELKQGFIELGKKFMFETEDINFSFIPTNTIEEEQNNTSYDYDCITSRAISKTGVYNCPKLINDYRGRCGANIADYSTKCYLETENCSICKSIGRKIYANDWE